MIFPSHILEKSKVIQEIKLLYRDYFVAKKSLDQKRKSIFDKYVKKLEEAKKREIQDQLCLKKQNKN